MSVPETNLPIAKFIWNYVLSSDKPDSSLSPDYTTLKKQIIWEVAKAALPILAVIGLTVIGLTIPAGILLVTTPIALIVLFSDSEVIIPRCIRSIERIWGKLEYEHSLKLAVNSPSEASKWLERAAELGDFSARFETIKKMGDTKKKLSELRHLQNDVYIIDGVNSKEIDEEYSKLSNHLYKK